ncbi:hypothetical protein [Peribacillus huizhouensis]|uniref:Uncharacterized protein n=1 Tax=Peribacillus huizhouensis TaxID=1501239 RepID=A0ABR6CRD1_9BACI|nr:hypothetical protein [Peribacillus huizhouensis]MBA9027587.1 hypothetical protein [Peribacillus huizhouensis]
MVIKIEIPTSAHTDYSSDKVRMEESWQAGYIEINHEGHTFEVRKSDLRKALMILCEEE